MSNIAHLSKTEALGCNLPHPGIGAGMSMLKT
jgi:hypothetical protein